MNTPVTCFTALISIAEEEQCEELESYLRSKGSSIVTSNELELVPRLQEIIKECPVVLNQSDISQQELEGFFYSVVSLFHVVSHEEIKNVLESFCSKIVEEGSAETVEWRLKLLGLMFCHFTEKDPLRYIALCHRVRLAGKTRLTGSLALDIDQLCRWLECWQVSVGERQVLFKLLWDVYKDSDKIKLCVRLLKELVKTYTETDADQGRSYAEALIVHSVADSSTFVMEDLLQLPAIRLLEGEKIHQLLKVFVYENLSKFEEFHSQNQAFMDQHGFSYPSLVAKMRQLTLSSMAESKDVISLSSLRDELKLGQEELDDFIIDCIQLKLLEARINQVQQTLVIMTSIHRTFGQGQWQFVHDRLVLCQESMQALKANLKTIKV